jgi:hypothetical protein
MTKQETAQQLTDLSGGAVTWTPCAPCHAFDAEAGIPDGTGRSMIIVARHWEGGMFTFDLPGSIIATGAGPVSSLQGLQERALALAIWCDLAQGR